jgi:hypothetical protein
LENTMIRLILVVVALLVPTAALAQDTLVKGLTAAGMPTVFVLDDRGVETRGRLVKLDDDGVVVLVGSAQRRFELARVNRVSRRGDSLKNGAIAGAVFGAVMGVLASGLAECSDDRGRISGCGAGARTALAVGSTAFYAAIGTGIDAAVQGRTVIYQAPAARISAGTKGMAVGMTLRW